MRLRGGMAIVGMGCRFPGGADTPARFWDLLVRGGDAVTEIPPDRRELAALYDPDPARPGTVYTRWGGFVDGIDRFDADFFGISPREARRIDPQQRLLLEVAWEALEDAGQRAERLAGSSTGVFVGISGHDYADLQSRPDQRELIDVHVNAGSALSIAANRISYWLDLRGPSMAVDTACSSALTALHLACTSLAAGECELALVGAANALLTGEPSIGFCKAGMLSPTGRCRPFDAGADGYVRSEGAGVIVVKPVERALEDGDSIYAVIRATGVNQDGRTPGLSVPSSGAQQALIAAVLRDAGRTPGEVQYVEAHGTGTPVGDPREAHALGAVMAARPPGSPCLVGSAKGNVGHLEAAAGMVGLVKVALALRHRQVPPSIHFAEPHPEIPFDELRLQLPTTVEPWPDTGAGPALAAVNSFGFGGANAHALLEEAPRLAPVPESEDGHDGGHLLVLSARSPAALRDLAAAWVDHLDDAGGAAVRDACATAARRRTSHEHRLAVAGETPGALRRPLAAFSAGDPSPAGLAGGRAPAEPPRVAFMFSGMGPLAWGTGRELAAREPAFAAALEECDRHLRHLAGWSVRDHLLGEHDRSTVDQPHAAHVANLAVQLALCALWRSWGVVPDAVVGHSSGEIAAACVAGAVDVAGAVNLAYHRGRLQQRKQGSGAMLAAGVGPDAVPALLDGLDGNGGIDASVTLAALNSPASVTLSGDADALRRVAAELEARGRFRRFLPVAVPYHSPALDDIRDELLEAAGRVPARPPAIPLASTVTGDWLDGRPLDAGHWWDGVRRPVQFAAAIGRLLEDGCSVFVEVGPHPVLGPSLRECAAAAGRPVTAVPSLRRGEPERLTMLRAAGALFVNGAAVDWTGPFGAGGPCVALPAYPWQRRSHWVSPARPAATPAAAGVDSGHPLLGRRLAAARPAWEVALGDDRLSFLDGHLVQDRVAFPAAGYVEACLAAAAHGAVDGADHPLAVERLELHRLLAPADRRDVALQVLAGPGDRLEVHSGRPGDPDGWTLRASARRSPRPPAPPPPVDLDAVRGRCRPVDVDGIYRALAAAGLRYEGAFRSLTGLWQGDGEVLGRVELPAGVDGGAPWHAHPALLDAALQALAAGAAGAMAAGGGVLLPVSVARVESHAPGGDRCWSHATVTRRDGRAIEAAVTLLDDDGRALLRCEGLQVRPVGDRAPGFAADTLYEERWEPASRPSGPTDAGAVAAAVQPAVDEAARACGLDEFAAEVVPSLDALARHFARAALTQLGFDPQADCLLPTDALAGRLGVAARHRRHLGRLVELARDAPPAAAPVPDPAALVARFPRCRSAVELVRESGERLAATLRGDEDARRWMVAGPWLDTLAELYGEHPGFRVYNGAVAEVVAALPRGRGAAPLRVLEVGAGTGGATGHVLDRLAGEALDYLATDVSPYFVKLLRHRFGDRPGFRAAAVDVEDPPPGLGPFDVVIAANVVHATADLRRTLAALRDRLAPGGSLVLMEALGRAPWFDLLFGQFEGWWRHADADLRADHPLLDLRTWLDVLGAAGLDVAAVADGLGHRATDPLQAVLVATVARPRPGSRPPRRWLVLSDGRGVGPELAAGLREAGDSCVLAWPGAAYRRYGGDGAELDPASAGDWARLLADAGPVDAVLHLWALDAPDEPEAGRLLRFQATTCASVAALFAALDASGSTAGDLWLVTAGAQPAGGDDGSPAGLGQAPLWGLGRVVRSERGRERCRLVDLGAGCPDEDVAALLAELLVAGAGDDGGAGDRDELAFRSGRRLARRLDAAVHAPAGDRAPDPVPRSPAEATFRVAVGRPGALDTLALHEVAPAAPGPGEVAVRLRAAALNYRDVLVALGLPFAAGGEDPASVPLGWEGAGVVEALGDGVTGLERGEPVMVAAAHALASRVVTRAGYAVPVPAGLGFEDAATLPVAFLTAIWALERKARLAAGERVLIHSASGGIGLAAVQVARLAGAEVLATAGTPEKRAYLESLGIEHVMDSRSLDFGTEVLRRTGGEGVDVVLNTLAGEAAACGVGVLRPFGRFVEIGKRDIYEGGRLELAPFRNNLSYLALDLQPLFDGQPELVGSILREVRDGVEAGRFHPLPHTDHDLAEAEQAFRLMAQARHIGKVVLTVGDPPYPVVPAAPGRRFRADGTYLVSGGLGGFGLAVARWMAAEGAGHLALVSRSGEPRPEDRPALEALVASGAEVVVLRGDVADAADVDRVLAALRSTMPPLAGVVHAAMVLDDGLLGTLDRPRFEAVLAPKVAGAWNLHAATSRDDLDVFVLFSSISAVVGQPGQANYAAANAFLDALATHRRSQGRPALSVAWGVIAGAGYVARHPDIRRRMARQGLLGMTVDDACAALGRLLEARAERAVVSRGRWGAGAAEPEVVPGRPAAVAAEASDRAAGGGILARLAGEQPAARPGVLEQYLLDAAARVLEAAGGIDPERRLYELGFDSLMAVELSTTVRSELGVDIPIVDLLDGLTVRSLGRQVLEGLDAGGGGAGA